MMRIVLLVLLTFVSAYSVSAKTVVILGDSISAGYGMDAEESWVQLLGNKVGNEHEIVNASISGNTTSMGLGRLPILLKNLKPEIVVIELGGNDGLQGHPLKVMRNNLSRMVEMSQEAGADVLLVGIQIPPNYGGRYTNEFFESFTTIAEKYDVPLLPFFLEGVALKPELMQGDGIHPTAEAQPILLENIWPYLQPMLEK